MTRTIRYEATTAEELETRGAPRVLSSLVVLVVPLYSQKFRRWLAVPGVEETASAWL